MKQLVFFLLLPLFFTVSVFALDIPDEWEDYLPGTLYEDAQSGDDLLPGGGEALFASLREEIGDFFLLAVRSSVKLMLLTLLCGLVDGVGSAFGAAAKAYLPYFSVLSAAMLCAGDLTALIGLGRETIEQLTTLSKALLPTVAMAMAAGGNIGSASVWQAGTLMGCDLYLQLSREVLLPLLYCYIGTAAAGAIAPESQLGRISELIKKGMNGALSVAAFVFTAYLMLSNVLSGTADKLSVKAGRLIISNAIPVVGSILSEATETLLSGAGTLRASFGILGVFAVLSVCLAPLLKLGIEYLCYRAAAFFSAMSGVSPLQKFMEQISSAFTLLMAMTGCASLYLLVALLVAVTMVSAV